MEYLLEKGCDPDKADMYKKTPLHIASLQNDRRAAELLVTGKCGFHVTVYADYTLILTSQEPAYVLHVQFKPRTGDF